MKTKKTLDAKDWQIINTYKSHGMISNIELADKVNLSPSACLRRVQKLEANGVIRGYSVIFDKNALDIAITVFVHITLETQNKEALIEFEIEVKRCDKVQSCYLMSGESDYLLKLAVTDMVDYENTYQEQIMKLPHIARVKSSFAIRTILESNNNIL